MASLPPGRWCNRSFTIPGFRMTGMFVVYEHAAFTANGDAGICKLRYSGECVEGPCLTPRRSA